MVVSGYVPFSTVSFTGAGVSISNIGYSDDGEAWLEAWSLEHDDTVVEKANVHNGAQVRFSCGIDENYTGTLQVFLGESQELTKDAEHFYSFTADGDSVIRCTGLTASGSAIGFTGSFSSGVTSFAKKTKTEKANVTRAQAVTALWQLAGAPKLSCSLCFEDVSPDADYADAFRWAYRTGVLKNRTSAKPDKTATRQWIAKLFWNYSGRPDSESFTETFKDEKKISALSKTAARWALAKGLFAGIADNSRLSPKAGVTAAQHSTITDNYKSAAGKEPAKICTLGYLTSPAGLFITASGNILAADNQNNKVWKIAARKATVYAGADTPIDVDDTPVGGYKDGNAKDALFSGCFAITDFMGGFAVSDTDNGAVRLIKNGKVSYLTTDPAAPTGLAADGDGRLYIADRDSGTISVLTTEGKISKLISGLKEPMGLAYFNGYVYVAEAGANRVVSVSVETGARSVVAGSGEEGMTDGAATAASFSAPMALAVTKAGDIYVADYANAAIRCIHLGEVTTVISDLDSDMIKSPTGLAILGNRLYVSDRYLHHIYAVMP